jgi:rsbT antagonist protein RsbS
VVQVPIIRIRRTLVATVQDELGDHDALGLQQDLADALSDGNASAVLLDLSAVETIDSFLARLIADIAGGSRLLGAETVVVGIRPAVAITLVELGLELRGVRTALSVEQGLALLDRRRAQGAGHVDRRTD